MSYIYIRPYKNFSSSQTKTSKKLLVRGEREKAVQRKTFGRLSLIASLAVHGIFLLTLALLPKPPEPPKNVLKLNGKTPVVTFKKELPPETIKEDKALTAVKKPVTATHTRPQSAAPQSAPKPVVAAAGSSYKAVNKASGPYTIPQAPAGNWDFLYHGMETGRKELSAASLVLNAGGRSFKNWPDFNFLEAAPFTVLNKNVRIELTIAGDGTILNSVILPPGSGNAALNDELIKALRNASFNEADSLNTESQTAILSINFRE